MLPGLVLNGSRWHSNDILTLRATNLLASVLIIDPELASTRFADDKNRHFPPLLPKHRYKRYVPNETLRG